MLVCNSVRSSLIRYRLAFFFKDNFHEVFVDIGLLNSPGRFLYDIFFVCTF